MQLVLCLAEGDKRELDKPSAEGASFTVTTPNKSLAWDAPTDGSASTTIFDE